MSEDWDRCFSRDVSEARGSNVQSIVTICRIECTCVYEDEGRRVEMDGRDVSLQSDENGGL